MSFRDFHIADFCLRIESREWEPLFGNFVKALARFESPASEGESPLLTLHTEGAERPAIDNFHLLDEFTFKEVEALCRFYANEEEYLLVMESSGGPDFWLRKPRTGSEAWCKAELLRENPDRASLFRFGVWMIFGLAITPCHAIAIHSSAICCDEGAALFLGESGTGKSTHTRLWREHIAGARLLNDDSPIIRLREGVPTVYGSPWSGKTPCYKAEHYPIRGFVRLSQAPHNHIRRLGVIPAIGALLPSCPPSFSYDPTLQDAICETLSQLISHTPVYHLECLPDREAAKLSCQTLFKRE